jgi:radical SAM protein with 4Fe4S-binding SPASM domain
MVTYDTNCCTLPPILDLWEAESDLATSVSKQNWHKSLFGPILHKSASGRFTVSCGTLGDTSPGVGSNQLTYICHHNAVDDDRKFADPKAHDGIVLDWSKDMLNEECYSCVAKYVCGGVCHRREKGSRSAECLFYRRAVKSSRMVQYAKDSGYLAAKMLSVNAPTLVPQNALDRWKSAKTLASAEAAVSTTSLQP